MMAPLSRARRFMLRGSRQARFFRDGTMIALANVRDDGKRRMMTSY